MHLNSNIDPRRFLDNNGFAGNPQREAALRYGPPAVWGTPDKQVLQKKDTNIDFSHQYHGLEQGDKCNNRAISPMTKPVLQAPSSPYSSSSPFKKITGIKKTPNGKQNSFHQHHGSSFIGQNNGGNVVITNSNFYNNSQETTLNTTDASFSQFLNQTANRSMLPVDLSNISQQQGQLSQRQSRQAASMHSQAQMGYKQHQNTNQQRVINGGLANIKGTPNNTQQKNGYGTYTPTYHQTVQNRQHHSVYTSPMNNTSTHENSSFLNDSELGGTPNAQGTRQYPTPYNRNKSTHINRNQSGMLLYNNMLNDSQNQNINTTQGSIYQVDDSNENVRLNSMASARGHNKNQSCYTPSSLNTQTNHNSSYHLPSHYDNFANATTKQINQIENFFSNPRQNYQNLNTTMGHNTSTSSMTPSYRQNTSAVITPRQMPTNLPANQERTLNGQIQQIPLNNQFNNSTGFGSMNTPTNHKHQKSCFQAFEYSNNNGSTSPQPYNLNVEQSIPNSSGGGHAKSHSLHQQRSTQSFHASGGSVNQSNFLQNSNFINHIQNKQFDSKSTFNPSSNFGSITQNKSGFLNSQSSFLNSNGTFLIPTNSGSSNSNAMQGNQNSTTATLNAMYQQNNGGQINATAAINGMLGQQYQQGSIQSKGPQIQKIIDDLKENIVKDLESLTSKLYKESESFINSQGNANTQHTNNTYESFPTLPIQLAEFNIGEDKKIRFSFSGREVITQITSTNMKLKKDPNENKENIISTYTTPLNSSQFLSPHQQQILSQQILNSGLGKVGIHTPRNTNKNNDSSTALHTFSSPQSVEESSSSSATPQASKNKLNNLIPTQSPNNNIKRPNIFNNPSKLFEKGSQKDKNSSSFQSSQYGDSEETPTSKNNSSNQNNSKQMNFEESVRITYAQQSQGEEKLFEEFFKNNESQESRQSSRKVPQNRDQSSAQMMVPEVENKKQQQQNASKIQQNQINAPALPQQKEQIQFVQPIIAPNNTQKQPIQEETQVQASNAVTAQPESPAQVEKDNTIQKKQSGELNSTNTPQKKESKVMNTEESENAPGKQTPCFQSSKSKNSNKNAVQQKTQSDEKNSSSGLTPFCLKFDNIKQAQKVQQSIPEVSGLENQESKQSQQVSSKSTLMRSNIMQEEQYEDELQSLTQNMSVQNKNDNLSDQDDVVLRTDNTDQLSEGSPKHSLYSSLRKSKTYENVQKSLSQKDQNNSSTNKLPLSQFQSQLEHIHEKECESGNSTPNAQTSQQQQQISSQQEQEEKKKKSPFNEYTHSASSSNILKEESQPVMKNSQTMNNTSLTNTKQINSENNEKSYLNNSNSSMFHVQDHCSYRGSAKSNHSSSSSSAQNRYQDSAVSSRKQSFIDNNNDSYLNISNIHNNNNSFTSTPATPGSNLKSSRYQQNAFNTPNNNLNNTSLRSKKLDDSSNGFQNTNTFNINSNNGISSNLNTNNHQSHSSSNLLNGTNIRFSTYLKQHEDTKNTQNQGLVFDNKNFNNNNSSSNNNANAYNNSYLSNFSSQPSSQLQTTSPVNTTSVTPRQFLFKNKSNLSLFQEYEAKMKTPTKQGQVDLNLSSNSINNGNNTSLLSIKPSSASNTKLHFNTAQMNKLQEEKMKRLDHNDDEVHTSRENPLEQIRENTNNTQENEDSQFLAFQNHPSTLTNEIQKATFLDHDRSSLMKPTISPEIQIKKDPPRPLLLDSESHNASKQIFFLAPQSANSALDNKKELFFTPMHKGDKLVSNASRISEKDESSSASSYKQLSQPTSSPYYISSRSNFYESTQKLIEDSVIIQNKKNDLSNGNISKYSYSSSSKSNNNNSSNNNNISGCSNQDDVSKRSENSRILRNPIDDDDDAILNVDDNLDNNILNHEDLKSNNNKDIDNNTPEKIKKSSPLQDTVPIIPNLTMNDLKSDSQNENAKTISNFESQTMISQIQEKKKPKMIEDDTPSSTVLFNDHSDSTSKKRAQFTFNIPNQQSSEAVDICRNLKQEIDSDYQFVGGFDRKNSNQLELGKDSSESSSDSINTPTSYPSQQQQSLNHSSTTPSLSLTKKTSLERDIQKNDPYGMKEFTFSTNSSQSLNNIPESNTVPSFSKSSSHQSLAHKEISSSIQVEDQDGCEITVSIVSHKRSSINQSKTILKKSLMGSPTSSALAKASSVKKSQRRISFKDKIEEVNYFEPEGRSTSRSPISNNKLPRAQQRLTINNNNQKGNFFDSAKKFPNILKDPSLLQQYKNKNPTNSVWSLNDTPSQSGTPISETNTTATQPSKEEIIKPSFISSRRNSQQSNNEDTSNSRLIKPLCFTPSHQKKQQQIKISFLEYSKINKNNN